MKCNFVIILPIVANCIILNIKGDYFCRAFASFILLHVYHLFPHITILQMRILQKLSDILDIYDMNESEQSNKQVYNVDEVDDVVVGSKGEF